MPSKVKARAQRSPLVRETTSFIARVSKAIFSHLNASHKRPRGVKNVECPIEAADGNLYFGGGYWWAAFRLTTIASYPNRTVSTQRSLLAKLEPVLRGMPGRIGRIYLTGDRLDIASKVDWWRDNTLFGSPDSETMQRFNQRMMLDQAILEDRQYRVRVVTLVIRLKDQRLRGDELGLTHEKYSRGKTTFGIQDPDNHRLIDEVAELYATILNNFPKSTPSTRKSNLNLIARASWRGTPYPPEAEFDETGPFDKPAQQAWLGEGMYYPNGYTITSDYLGDRGEAGYMMLCDMPQAFSMPGSEYLNLIDLRGDPVPIIVLFRVLSAAEVLEEMRKQQDRLDEWGAKLRKWSGDANSEAFKRAQQGINQVREDADANQMMKIEMEIVAVATGATPHEVTLNQKYIIANSPKGFVWVTPLGLQGQIHEGCIPGNDWITTSYVHLAPLHALAAGGLCVTDVPTVQGSLIGELSGSDRGPFQLNLPVVFQQGIETTPLVLSIGPQGSGKTFFTLDVALMYASLNAIVLYRETYKRDSAKINWATVPNAPRHWELELSSKLGVFNPMWWGETPGEQATNTTTFLTNNIKNADSGDEDVIFRFALAACEAPAPDGTVRDIRDIVRAMLDHKTERIQAVGEKLLQLIELKEIGVCIGTKRQADDFIDDLQPGLTIWRSSDWVYPNPNSPAAKWTARERFTVSAIALQYPCTQRLTRRRNVLTVVIDDEAHMIFKLPGGEQALYDAIHTDRSGRNIYWCASQSYEDVPLRAVMAATTAICYRPLDTVEAQGMARLLHLDPSSEEVIARLKSLGCDEDKEPVMTMVGECYIRYPNGQLARGRNTGLHLGQFESGEQINLQKTSLPGGQSSTPSMANAS
jgi:hypothetical protein